MGTDLWVRALFSLQSSLHSKPAVKQDFGEQGRTQEFQGKAQWLSTLFSRKQLATYTCRFQRNNKQRNICILLKKNPILNQLLILKSIHRMLALVCIANRLMNPFPSCGNNLPEVCESVLCCGNLFRKKSLSKFKLLLFLSGLGLVWFCFVHMLCSDFIAHHTEMFGKSDFKI